MKKTILFIMATLLAGSVSAGNLDEGTKEVRVSGIIDFETAADTLIDLNFGMGYFIRDLVEVGGLAGIRDNDVGSTWRIGTFGEYTIDTGYTAYPFFGAALSIAGADLKVAGSSSSETGLELELFGGYKFFLTEDLAVDGTLSLRTATEDIYVEDNDVENTDLRLLLGLRYFYD